jgi:alkylation response protein AidB-like acyl-CoA dehydrogenase
MIEFSFTEEQIMLRDMVRDFVNNELKPVAVQIDENEAIPEEIINKIKELGLLGAAFPVEYGGSGFGEVGYCIIQEEITRACQSTATFIGAHQSIGTNSIYIGGSEEQKQRFLPDLTSGKKIAAYALTEPQAGSDAFNLSTRAELNSDEWVINGEKMWITNAPFADIFSVYARTKMGISLFVVPADTPGLTVGAPEKKLGIRGSKTASVTFDNVKIPKENLLGRDGRGFLIAMKTLDAGRLGLGAATLGTMKEVLEISTQYAKQRKQFGEPIGNFQAVQFMLAEMAIKIYQCESVVYRTAAAYDAKTMKPRDAAIVKYACSEALSEITDLAIQVHGGMGFSRELPLERFYRDARINRIFEGTNEIQKIIIAKDLIKRNGKM